MLVSSGLDSGPFTSGVFLISTKYSPGLVTALPYKTENAKMPQ
jgi:hypothetical protein